MTDPLPPSMPPDPETLRPAGPAHVTDPAAPLFVWAPAPPKPRRSHAKLIIAVITVLIVLGSAGWAASRWPAITASGPASDFAAADPQSPWLPDHVPDSARFPEAWVSMNTALRENDREVFLSYTAGDAQAQLALWWDNTAAIGRETAYIVPVAGQESDEGAFLGAELAFSSRPLRGSGDADAGYRLTQGFGYDITTTGDGDDLRITSFVPWSPMPWDEGPLHVAKRDHIVLYGMADEKELVEATVDVAERGAVLAIETITGLGGSVPMTGFVAGITDDQERMNRWQFGEDVHEGETRIAGYATATNRPYARSDLFESDIAVGDATSGVLVMMGPLSTDQRLSTFTHEFAHGLHYAASPLSSYDDPPVSVYEGFATYIELRTGLLERDWLRDVRLRDLIATQGAEALTDDRFSDEDAWLSYLAAGTYYLFLAENGGDPWKLALDGAATSGRSLVDIVGDPAFSEERWQAWIARR